MEVAKPGDGKSVKNATIITKMLRRCLMGIPPGVPFLTYWEAICEPIRLSDYIQ
jgi:hypothetical protein